MDRLFAIAALFAIGYGVYFVVRFVIAMISAPKGSIINALSDVEFDRAADDAWNPILRGRRLDKAQGKFMT